MTGKERGVAALTFKEFDILPIEIDDCCGTKFEYPGWYQRDPLEKRGKHIYGWGCVWEAKEDGVFGKV